VNNPGVGVIGDAFDGRPSLRVQHPVQPFRISKIRLSQLATAFEPVEYDRIVEYSFLCPIHGFKLAEVVRRRVVVDQVEARLMSRVAPVGPGPGPH
jgi:hypothetical protein